MIESNIWTFILNMIGRRWFRHTARTIVTKHTIHLFHLSWKRTQVSRSRSRTTHLLSRIIYLLLLLIQLEIKFRTCHFMQNVINAVHEMGHFTERKHSKSRS